MPKFYITTPIYYVNDNPHLGTAYTTIAADVLARHHRMKGEEVFFLTGTDENASKVVQAAEKAGKSPREFCDEKSARFQMTWDSLNISHDGFIRTTEPRHEKAVRHLLQKLYDKGLFYKGKYEGLYCVGCEEYKTESDLVEGKCPMHKTEPEILAEENWFFKLSRFNGPLKDLIEKDILKVCPESRKNEILGLLKSGLEDIAISREKQTWGIKLPFDESQVAYVWIDALINYLTGVGYPEASFKNFWPADVHLMGKDILKFHAAIWPAMLLGAEVELPKQVFAHGFFTINGQKMSKTLGNVIDPVALSREYGVDPIRYFLLSEFSFGQDGDFSVNRLKERFNADLANGLGNLVSRIIGMFEKYGKTAANNPENLEMKKIVQQTWESYEKSLEKLQFKETLEAVWRLIAFCNGYVDENKPWVLAKENKEKLKEVLYDLLETIRHLGWMIQPVMPQTSDKILKQLGVLEKERKISLEDIKNWGRLEISEKISRNESLFPRL